MYSNGSSGGIVNVVDAIPMTDLEGSVDYWCRGKSVSDGEDVNWLFGVIAGGLTCNFQDQDLENWDSRQCCT